MREAVQSVAAQSHRPLELILVDDGVPDRAELLAVASIAKNARVIQHATSGVSGARNAGAAQAAGAYLAFIDDDDRWDPERVRRQVRDLEAAPTAPAGYCLLRTIDEHGAVLVEPDRVAVASIDDLVTRRTGIVAPNLMVRTAAFRDAGGFDERLRMAEDYDLILRLGRRGQILFSADALVDYRHHPGNTTGRHRELALAIAGVVAADRIRQDGERPSERAYREARRANDRYAWWASLRAARARRSRGDVRGAVAELAWAVSFAPWAPALTVARRVRRRAT